LPSVQKYADWVNYDSVVKQIANQNVCILVEVQLWLFGNGFALEADYNEGLAPPNVDRYYLSEHEGQHLAPVIVLVRGEGYAAK
jgi:hypothetical protein